VSIDGEIYAYPVFGAKRAELFFSDYDGRTDIHFAFTE
jgi:hypothetical protein